ncbi:MAG: DUF1178 family protein [Deltaproteobacteria bacterium]|nr:DUF1178 family protein [Deltaproteobacteria bacterium]
MIIYDLKCSEGHTFEGWFNDLAAFEEQRSAKIITCPVCGSEAVEITPSVVNFVSSAAEESNRKVPPASMAYEFITKGFEDVGDNFADVALKMHRGEEEHRNIRGTTTASEEDRLREEGVLFVKLQIPKFSS